MLLRPFSLPVHLTRSVLLAVILACALGSCAKRPDRFGMSDTPQIRPVTLEIKNNLTIPSEVSIYLTSPSTGSKFLGVVPTGTKTFEFIPRTYAEVYQIRATLPFRRYVLSQEFNVGTESTGWIQWMMVPNMLAFWERAPDEEDKPDAPPPDTAKAPKDTANKHTASHL